MTTQPTRRGIQAGILLTVSSLLLFASPAQAGGNKTFGGDGRTDWGGPIGKATLQLTDDTTNVTGTLTVTQGDTGGNVLVLYLQAGTNPGFTDTSGFADNADGIRTAISGYGGSRSTLTFLPGFTPNYAVGIQLGTFGGLWGLANGGANSLPFISSVNLTPSSGTTAATYTFSFSLASVGLPTGPTVVGQNIKILGTLISTSGYRSPESIAGDTDGTSGWNPTAQTALATYPVGQVPTTTYPVTFQVDMSAVLANGNFIPGNGDQVEARGSFNGNAGAFYLTPSANTNIYKGTFNCPDPLGTLENYKFDIVQTTPAAATNYEKSDARTFTLASTQTLPVVYFSDLAPATNATVPLTFYVNMGVQAFAGNFNPANGDQVYVFGVFNQDSTYTWIPGSALTPTGTNANVYTGTMGDGNYAGTFCQYKFVYFSNNKSQYIYESIPNRDYNTPASAQTFPTVYFNNQTNAVLVTFQVDMTLEVQEGTFVPGQSGQMVEARGSFQNPAWSGGFTLTNNPNAANTNIFSGVTAVTDPPGTVEQFKFVLNNSYETPADLGGGNRSYTLTAASNQTVPLVSYNDLDANDILTSDTTVTFQVNMAGAVGTDSHVWSPAGGDIVYVNGPWQTPNAWAWGSLTDALSAGVSNTNIWTIPVLFPAGSSLAVTYKYGINDIDNESGIGNNHIRYIRHLGSYTMPLDTFGTQTVEPQVGYLTNSVSGGQVTLTWNGRPGVHLQSKSSLTSGVWQDVANTTGLSTISLPVSGTSKFYRLIKP